jgi:beta-fructofuranosidase
LTDEFLLGDEVGRYYGAKVVKDPHGRWVLLPMLFRDENGRFVGEMGDPLPLQVAPRGLLELPNASD